MLLHFVFRKKLLAGVCKNLKNNIVKVASTEQAAFRLAASECYEVLTNGQYPGEEKGLVIIDICANPKM